jgi:secreted trypsin-like serine protease
VCKISMWIVKYITALVLMIEVANSHTFLDDSCTLQPFGSPGVCKLMSHCKYAVKQLHKYSYYPQICGVQRREPIVCCPNKNKIRQVRKPGEMSKKKCKEYSEYVNEIIRPPILLPNVRKIKRNECGHKVSPLIVGGEMANIREFPHMTAIGYKNNSDKVRWLCGGTILSEQYILTAAHCLHDKDYGKPKYVQLGTTNLFDKSSHRQRLNILKLIPHPQYMYPSNYHDIALIKLEKPAKMNSYARPACLYSKPEISFERAIATGWGDVTLDGGVSNGDLRKVTLKLVDNDSCNSSYIYHISKKKLKNGIVKYTQLCAGSKSEKKIEDTCFGDSGGPLQIYHVDDGIYCMYDIIGVTSFGKSCSGESGVYTRVSNYVKWIEDIVWPSIQKFSGAPKLRTKRTL